MYTSVYCLGDSNTYGFDPRSPFGDRYEGVWCQLLAQELPCKIYGDGVNGRRIREVLQHFDLLEKMLWKQSPDLLMILLGSNDILMEDAPDASMISGRMEDLLKRLRFSFPALPILLLSPPEIRLPGPWRETAYRVSDLYASLARTYGTDFLDLSRCSLSLSCDGVHFSQEGHRQLAEILKSSLQKSTSDL